MSPETAIELDAEYRQLREKCGLVERPGRGVLTLRGSETAEYLQGQLTNDIEALEPGQGCYAALLDRKGHIQGDMRVLRVKPDEVRLDLEPAALGTVRRHLDMYKIGREVELVDETGSQTLISLIGPGSPGVCGVSPGGEHANTATRIGGVDCLAVSTADDGVDLFCAATDANPLRVALLEAGAVPVSEDAAEILRVEAGVPRFGPELGPQSMPAEAGIVERAVNFTKGCYIGQEPVARLHYRGRPNRHLRGLRLEAPADSGTPLHAGDREVGVVATSVVSPALGPIALAIVRKEAEPGTAVAVGAPDAGDQAQAEVVELPFRDES